jgi:hypothetical protein
MKRNDAQLAERRINIVDLPSVRHRCGGDRDHCDHVRRSGSRANGKDDTGSQEMLCHAHHIRIHRLQPAQQSAHG